MDLPYSVIRGEQVAIKVIVFNYENTDMKVLLTHFNDSKEPASWLSCIFNGVIKKHAFSLKWRIIVNGERWMRQACIGSRSNESKVFHLNFYVRKKLRVAICTFFTQVTIIYCFHRQYT